MATGKALDGKPYAGNPHVRFDEGEVASAATPRRGSLLYDKYIASFAGLFPADDPKYVLVVCYETKRTDGTPYLHLGGGRPAMAFAEIASRTLQNTKL